MMRNFKPTPGPWRPAVATAGFIFTTGGFRRFHVVDKDGNEVPLCDNDKGRMVKEAASNVRLMAASWEMLRALEVFEAAYNAAEEDDYEKREYAVSGTLRSFGWDGKGTHVDFLDRLRREAIAAAKGESS